MYSNPNPNPTTNKRVTRQVLSRGSVQQGHRGLRTPESPMPQHKVSVQPGHFVPRPPQHFMPPQKKTLLA